MMPVTLFFDGLCMPKNPGGVATFGYVVYSDDQKLHEGYGFVGAGMFGDDVSNNVAEYHALIRGLERLLSEGYDGAIEVKGDSQLVISQLKGEYAVRARRLIPLHKKALALLGCFRNVELHWIPREENSEADRLSRNAFEEFLGKHYDEYKKFYGTG
ncbi:MAG: ribonuclease HI [Candidatus Verstraetearchaeota archaeon]|nr:ribonuclease HI [Candidatus Verstraetearchaeota archaeon]